MHRTRHDVRFLSQNLAFIRRLAEPTLMRSVDRPPEGTKSHSNQDHSFRRRTPPGTKSKVSKASVHTRLMSADCSPLPHNLLTNQHDQRLHSGLGATPKKQDKRIEMNEMRIL